MKPDSDTPIPLVFDWKKPRRAGLSLLIWLLITSAAMGVFFYIFKVVYPQSQRFTPMLVWD